MLLVGGLKFFYVDPSPSQNEIQHKVKVGGLNGLKVMYRTEEQAVKWFVYVWSETVYQ